MTNFSLKNDVMIDEQELLNRFLEYVRIETTADPNSNNYPSSEGQRVLGALLTKQLIEMGASNVEQDEHGLVWATIRSNVEHSVPVVLLNAHLDTSPEASGKNVRPSVIEKYDGLDISLGDSGKKITIAHCPALADLVGKTLVVTDGNTLLGGDDKAGIASIMQIAKHLTENPNIPHGEVRLLFTCDEEIGRGTQHVDLKKLNAQVGYTLDGGDQGKIDYETFSADAAEVRFMGKNIHPSIGKNRMVNSIRAAAVFIAQLPIDHLSPESTDGRDGFLHPYELKGGVAETVLQILLRDFDTTKLGEYKTRLEQVAEEVENQFPGLSIEVNVRRQYRNMADGIKKLPQSISLAEKAFQQLNVSSERTIIRGGTDGALLTEMGLPTPNLSVGQHNIHSELEFACLDQMALAAYHVIQLISLWASSDPSV